MLATMDAVEGLPAPNREGRQLGKYHLIAELARGGMGVVFLALVRGPAGFHKLFVVKELRTHLAEDPELVSMFLEEARLAAKLSHPNVVQTIEVGSEGGRHFIAMEHLDGQSYGRVLSRLRKSGLNLPLAGHLHVLSQVLEGLQYAHSRGEFGALKPSVVHRDMSPQNILLTFDGQVKIIDFGIAKSLESSAETRTGVLKGKLSYMAPEQAAGEPPDGRSDVFSVGVMLWEAVVGTRMWSKAQNDMRILHALTRGEIPRPAEDKPDIDADLERIILRATAPRARDRYASAAEFQADIENHLRWLAEPQFGSREIQKLLGAAFAEERASTKMLVDAELRSPSTPDAATDSALFGRGSGPPAPSGLPPEPGVTQTYQTSLEQLASQHTRREGKAGGGRNRAVRIAVMVAVAGSLVAGGAWLFERNQSAGRVDAATMAAPAASAEPPPPQIDSAGAPAVARPSPGTASPMPQSTGAALRPEAPTAPRSILPWPRRAPPPPAAPPVATVTPSNAAPSTAQGASPAEPVSQTAAPDSPAPSSGRVKKQIDTRDPYAD
jgi:serine/threonine-protein kinase